MSSEKKYDDHGCRMTDCCGAFATYGPDVNYFNLDIVPLKCEVCGKLTTQGEGDATEFRDGITHDIWLARANLMEMVDSAEEI